MNVFLCYFGMLCYCKKVAVKAPAMEEGIARLQALNGFKIQRDFKIQGLVL